MRVLRAFLVFLVFVCVALVALRLTHALPDRSAIEQTVALPPSAETRLGRTLAPQIDLHPGLSGIAALADGRDALAVRTLLIRAAEASLDVQYYIWQADTTGWLLLDELRAAADRGVRVRLLLDDNGIPGLDDVLSALNSHPNFEVRLFNPFMLRQPKLLSYGFDLPRLNRRMHNKSMTADGLATIVGGRNVGDIYFAYGEGVAYYDLDMLGVGEIATAVSTDFDLYWNSDSSYPAEHILPASDTGRGTLATAVDTARQSILGSDYLAAIASSPLVENLLAGKDILEWTEAVLVSDDPAKGLGRAARENLLMERLAEQLSEVEQSVDVVSAYLIPGKMGSALFEELAIAGREVRLVTNSLEATDVPVVHSAWMRYRDQMVAAGVRVLELRSRSNLRAQAEDFTFAQILTGSTSSLHAKTFSIDGRQVFVGSFNFDPRSAALNTEMGILFDSPAIAQRLSRSLDEMSLVYDVKATGSGGIEWHELTSNGETVVHDSEPRTSFILRAFVRAGSWLPIEWML